VRGKIVLVGASPAEAQELAIGRFGAVGMVSYQQNQKTAWSADNDNLLRWGHLQSFTADKTFAFMVSLKTARALQARLRRGDNIRLHATVHAGQHAGFYEIATATIEGSDSRLKNEEIAFSCHLDHQRPGANDNASGCVTILEVARTLQKLIDSGALERPARISIPPSSNARLSSGLRAVIFSPGSHRATVPQWIGPLRRGSCREWRLRWNAVQRPDRRPSTSVG
jgi:hypothetical protein